MTAPDPVFLETAREIVLRAGEIQMARRESGFRVAKKGTIDLVTEVDLECERMCRAIICVINGWRSTDIMQGRTLTAIRAFSKDAMLRM